MMYNIRVDIVDKYTVGADSKEEALKIARRVVVDNHGQDSADMADYTIELEWDHPIKNWDGVPVPADATDAGLAGE